MREPIGRDSHENGNVREWSPGTAVTILWNVLGLGLVVAGLALFAGLHAATHGGDTEFSLDGAEVLVGLVVTLGLSAALVATHEWLHGLAMQRYGAQPRYGAGLLGKVIPYLSCTAEGHRFGKGAFLVIALTPFGGWLVLPAAIHLGGCIGDFWMSALVLARPATETFEDTGTGIRFHAGS